MNQLAEAPIKLFEEEFKAHKLAILPDKIDYQVIRSERRKTIALQVKAGKVYVRAPLYVKPQYIDNLIQSKLSWLHAKIHQQLLNQAAIPEQDYYQNGSQLWVAGECKNVIVVVGKKSPIKIRDNNIIITIPSRLITCEISQKKQIKKQLEQWYKAVAETYFPKRIEYWHSVIQLDYKSVKIKKYKARWGSCNSRNELSFNYLLLMCPNWVIDYVIVHEFCHLKHLNHSSDFWTLVTHYYPEYKQAKSWLKQHQDQLYLP